MSLGEKMETPAWMRGKVFWISYYRRGANFRESDGRTEAEAKKLLRRRLAEIHSDRFIRPQEERLRVSDLLDALVIHAETKGDRSLGTMASQIKPIRREFGDMKATSLSAAYVGRYQKQRMASGRANGTINREVALLKRAYNLAQKGRPNRVPYIEILPEQNVRQGFFEADQFAAVLKHLPKPIADAASFTYRTGWRKGEVAAATESAEPGELLRRVVTPRC